IDDEYAVCFEVRKIRFQRSRIHRNEDVHSVAGRENLIRREMELVTAYAGQGSGGGADFGREVRERGDVVAVKRHSVRERASRNLHTVARVSGEANYRAVNDFALGGLRQRYICSCSHSSKELPQTESITQGKQRGCEAGAPLKHRNGFGESKKRHYSRVAVVALRKLER